MQKIALTLSVLAVQFFFATAHADSTPAYPIEIDSNITEQAQLLLSGANERAHLFTNILNSEFAIRQKDGTVIGEGRQGLLIDDWNLELMISALKKGVDIRLSDYLLAWQLSGSAINNGLDSHSPQETLNPEYLKRLQADLTKAVQLPTSDETGLRYLAQLIVALGRENTVPYDLLATNLSPNVALNAIQYGLLTQRLAPELLLRGKKFAPQSLMPAAFKVWGLDAKTAPCTMTDTEGLIMDATATGIGTMAPGFLEFLVENKFATSTGFDKFVKISGGANIVLNYVKLAWSVAAFKATLKAEKNPLTRTKTKVAGEQTNVAAQFSMDGGNAQIVNCFRPALNLVGIDFSLPQGGPLVGSLVEWQIATRIGSENDVIQTVGVDPNHQETDSTGRSEITVEGKPQKTDLSQKKLVQIDRTVEILASVNLKNKNPKQDAIDLFSGLSGIGALWSLPVEVLNRAPLLFNAKTKLIVHDWKELEGDHFRVEATYNRPDFFDRGVDVKLANIKDKVTFDFELKINSKNNETEVILLSSQDGRTNYKEYMQPEFTAGEGCLGKQTPIGEYEAFILRQKPLVQAFYQPPIVLPPGVVLPPGTQLPGEMMTVSFYFSGPEHFRGWEFVVDDKSCEMDNYEEEDSTEWIRAQATFNSLQLHEVGQSMTINNGDWVFVVTYVE